MKIPDQIFAPFDYGSPENVAKCRRIVAGYEAQIRSGKPLNRAQQQVMGLCRTEIAYASLGGLPA